jgi:hypothetical protein
MRLLLKGWVNSYIYYFRGIPKNKRGPKNYCQHCTSVNAEYEHGSRSQTISNQGKTEGFVARVVALTCAPVHAAVKRLCLNCLPSSFIKNNKLNPETIS